jgi:hypothetical protein
VDVHQKRRCYILSHEHLEWSETIYKWRIHPGPAKWTLPSDPLFQLPTRGFLFPSISRLYPELISTGMIELQIDLRQLFHKKYRLRKTNVNPSGQTPQWRNYVEYSIVLQLDGDKVQYRIHIYPFVTKPPISMQLVGNSSFVDVTTSLELGDCPRARKGVADKTADKDGGGSSSSESGKDNSRTVSPHLGPELSSMDDSTRKSLFSSRPT